MASPELASIWILEAALDGARNAIMAAHPDVCWEDDPECPRLSPGLQSPTARILDLAELLLAEIPAYRPAPPRADRTSISLPEEDPLFPEWAPPF
jgi:hypothetical protein